jgi:hypothetical protein
MRQSKSLADLVTTIARRSPLHHISCAEPAPKSYPTDAAQYELLEECGRGVR